MSCCTHGRIIILPSVYKQHLQKYLKKILFPIRPRNSDFKAKYVTLLPSLENNE